MTPAIIALLCALSLSVGVGGTLGLQAALQRDEQPAATVEAVASVVEQTQAPEVLAAETRLAVVQAPAVNLAVEALMLDPDTSAEVKAAMAAYLGCIAGSQAQAQGAAAYGCPAMAELLVLTVRAGLGVE